MGERLLAHALAAEAPPLNEIEVISTGVSAYPGEPASRNSLKALQKVGLDLSNHRSQPLRPEHLDNALAVFVMTEAHRAFLDALQDSDPPVPVFLYRELMGAGHPPEVPDPFGADLPAYLETRDALAEAVPSIVAWLREKTAPAKA